MAAANRYRLPEGFRIAEPDEPHDQVLEREIELGEDGDRPRGDGYGGSFLSLSVAGDSPSAARNNLLF